MEDFLNNSSGIPVGEIMKQIGINFDQITKSTSARGQAVFPKYRQVEYEESHLYSFELAGFLRDDIVLSKKGNILTISGTRLDNVGSKDGDKYGGKDGKIIKDESKLPTEFKRNINLSSDCGKISDAVFDNGILHVTVDKVTDDDEETVQIN